MNEDRARQGVEHLQAAAIEVIGAVRAFLDVAESVVRDPAGAATMAASLADAARAAATPPSSSTAPSDAEPRVTRIRVS